MADIYGFTLNIDGNAIKEINNIKTAIGGVDAKAKETESVFAGMFKFELLKEGLSLLKDGIASVYSIGSSIEQTKMSFDVLLGSSEKGSKFFNDLKKFADFTPFTNKEAFDAGQMLLNYGVQAEMVIPYLNMLGDASVGNSDKFMRLSYAFSQVAAMGRLQGGDLRQMVEAGFNPLQIISEKTGESMVSLKDRMEKGNVSFEEMANAFKIATSEGGRFENMMIKQSTTTAGMASTLQSYWESLQVATFDNMSGSLKEGIGLLGEWTNNFTKLVEAKDSENLEENMTNIDAMFEVLKSGNLDIEQRKSLIAELNGKYGEYLSNLVKESDTYAEIADNQERSNSMMLKKIEQKAKEEIISDYSDDVQQAQKDEIKARILMQKVKSGEDLSVGEKAWIAAKRSFSYNIGRTESDSDLSILQKISESAKTEKERAKYELQAAISGVSPKEATFTGYDRLKKSLDISAGGLISKKNEPFSPLVAKNIQEKDKKLLPEISGVKSTTDESKSMKDAASSDTSKAMSEKAAKILNVYFNKEFVKIETNSVDSKSIVRDENNIFARFALMLEDVVYNQGSA